MNTKPAYTHVPWQLFIIFVMLAVGIGLAGNHNFKAYKNEIRKARFDEISAIADLKVRQITEWRMERMADARFFAQSRYIAECVVNLCANLKNTKTRQEIISLLQPVRAVHGYSNILVADIHGTVLWAIDESVKVGPYLNDLIRQAIDAKKVIFSDFFRCDHEEGRVMLSVVAPVTSTADQGTSIIGVLLFNINPFHFLYPLIQSWPVPSATAETLIVSREDATVMFLNELRHRKDTALTLRMPIDKKLLPAAVAIRGEKTIIEGYDYRGEKVLAAVRSVPDSRWHMVSKIDQTEVYAQIHRYAWIVTLFVGTLILGSSFAFAFTWYWQHADLVRMQYETELEQMALIRHYDYLTKFANDIILLMDKTLHIIEANDRAVAAYGYAKEKLLKLSLMDLCPPGERAALDRQIRFLDTSGESIYETRERRKDGSTFPVEISSRVIEIEGQKFYQNIVRDISARKRSEELMRRHEFIVNTSRDFMTLINADYVYEAANDAYCRAQGLERDAIIGHTVADIWGHEVFRTVVKGHIDRCMNGEEVRYQTWFELPRTELRYFNVTFYPYYGEKDVVTHAMVVTHDITDIKRIEEDLQESRRTLLTLLGNLPGMAYRCRNDRQWTMEFISEGGLALTGYDVEDLLHNRRLSYAEIIHPEDREDVWEGVQAGLRDHRQYELVYRVRPAAGAEKWVWERGVGVYATDGKLFALEGFISDITELKEAERTLRQSEAWMRSVFRVAPVGIGVVVDRIFTHVNDRMLTMLGYASEELIGRSSKIIYASDEEFEFVGREKYEQITANGVGSVETKFKRKDGSEMNVLLSSAAIDPDDVAKGVMFTALDITALKRTEEALQDRYAELEEIFRAIPDAVVFADTSRHITKVNTAFTRLFGYEESEVRGKEARIIYTSEDSFTQKGETVFTVDASRDVRYAPYEIAYVRKDGTTFLSETIGTVVSDSRGNPVGFIGIIRDITERKRREEEYVRLATAVDQASESIIITDSEGVIQYVNPAFEATSGYTRDEVVGQTPRILKSGKHEAAFYISLWETIKSGKTWKGRFINQRKNGTLVEEETTISPVRDSAGTIFNFVGMQRDVTEEIRLEKQLRQAQKMEAIGTLAGGIAHDFNNILSAIIGYTELSMFEVSPTSRLYRNLESLSKASNRAKELVRQILAFSRMTEQEQKPIQVSLITKEALKLLRASLPTTIDLKQNIQSNALMMGDPTQMHQVLINLCTNASQSMEERGGTLAVGLSDVVLDDSFAALHPDITPGHYIRMTISDTGYGMTQEIIERIFDPFFTTKERGEGTGLGLSIVHGIVKDHGGAILVTSEPGKGTVFDVYFPVLVSNEVSREPIEDHFPTGHERILFVDDEQALADVNKKMMERLGYHVTARTSSRDALESFKSAPDEFDLVITDMTMPKMTGEILAQEILRIRPDIPIILCTGYSGRMTEEKAKSLGIKAFVMKPILKTVMAETIRRVLDGRKGNADT